MEPLSVGKKRGKKAIGPWSSWLARIKWQDGGDPITISVSKIRDFEPKSKEDFDKHRWYRVKGSAKYWDDGKEHSAYALIGVIAETEEEMACKIKKRVTFSSVAPPSSDALSSDLESETQGKNAAISSQQAKAADTRAGKTQLQNAALNKFAMTFMGQDNPSQSGQGGAEILPHNRHRNLESNPPSAMNSSDGELIILRKRVRELEGRNSELLRKCSEPNQHVEDRLQKIEAEMKKFLSAEIRALQRSFESLFEKRVQESIMALVNKSEAVECLIQRSLSQPRFPSGGSSPVSTRSVSSDDSVPLSDKFKCSRYCFEKMSAAEKDADWAGSLLKGVFGDDAAKYRVYPRKEGLKPFPNSFLQLAQDLYKTWLTTKNVRAEDIEKEVKKLPGYLSDIANNMGGHRGRSRATTNTKRKRLGSKKSQTATEQMETREEHLESREEHLESREEHLESREEQLEKQLETEEWDGLARPPLAVTPEASYHAWSDSTDESTYSLTTLRTLPPQENEVVPVS